jgi:tRNA1Val (adenine37-N6)-methyltransferase
MSSINPYFTINYIQPLDYRFSHDSVFMAREVFNIIQSDKLNYSSILDVCAGCGIVGLDLAFHIEKENLTQLNRLDFIEIQKVYEPFLNANIQTLNSIFNIKLKSDIYYQNYDAFPHSELDEKYDIIVCNPPYFRTTQGKLSPSEFKNRCRFFIDSNLTSLINCFERSLKVGGSAFVLLHSLQDHKINIMNELPYFPNLKIVPRGKIRSTDLFQLLKY